ncbi:MAG: hypothetical protein BGO76_04625 [Caedibacter sp. 38-128]|nr:hypothetical protein [Holosporales bacterium]OJX04347.1 MAG: hypothetical protein BGO76_04625 [Caedibacter sp. 38-128]
MKGSIFLFLPSRPFFVILRGLPSPPDFLSSLDPSYAEGFTEARDGDSGKAEVHQLVIGEVFTSLESLGTSPRMTMFKTYSRHPRSYAEDPRQPEDVDRRQKVPSACFRHGPERGASA